MNRLGRMAILVGSATVFLGLGCGDHDGGGPVLGFLNISSLDPGFETYTGSSTDLIFEKGYVDRILASTTTVRGGTVSVQFQDVEQQEIHFPSDSNSEKIPLDSGGTYVFHGWFYAIDIGGGATVGDVPLHLAAVYYSGSTLRFSSEQTVRELSSFGSWQELAFTFTVPTGTDRGYMSIGSSAEVTLNVCLFIDDLSIERIS